MSRLDNPVDFMRWYHEEFRSLWVRLASIYAIPDLRDVEKEEEGVYCGRVPGRVAFWPRSQGSAIAMSMVADVNKWVVWNFCKRAYLVHPALQEAVTESVDERTAIPGEVLRQLPHDEALLWLAQPITQWSKVDRRQETYFGLMYMGAKQAVNNYPPTARGVQLCQLSDPDADRVSITFIGYYDEIREGGSVRFPTRFTLSVGLDETWTLMGAGLQIADSMNAVEEFELGIESITERRASVKADPFEFVDDEIMPLLRVAIGLLAYICSQDVDLERRPKPRNKAAARREMSDGVSRYNLGYRIGPKIDASARRTTGGTVSSLTGRSVAPHIRRGHFHTVRYGPGHSLKRVQWFAPTAVNRNKDVAADTVTYHGLGNAG